MKNLICEKCGAELLNDEEYGFYCSCEEEPEYENSCYDWEAYSNWYWDV